MKSRKVLEPDLRNHQHLQGGWKRTGLEGNLAEAVRVGQGKAEENNDKEERERKTLGFPGGLRW